MLARNLGLHDLLKTNDGLDQGQLILQIDINVSMWSRFVNTIHNYSRNSRYLHLKTPMPHQSRSWPVMLTTPQAGRGNRSTRWRRTSPDHSTFCLTSSSLMPRRKLLGKVAFPGGGASSAHPRNNLLNGHNACTSPISACKGSTKHVT